MVRIVGLVGFDGKKLSKLVFTGNLRSGGDKEVRVFVFCFRKGGLGRMLVCLRLGRR